MAELESFEQLTSDLKEQSKSEVHVVHDEIQGAQALAMSHSRELEAAKAAASEAESDCFAAERLALEEELADLRSLSGQQQQQGRLGAQSQQGNSWFSELVMGSLCCVRQPPPADGGSSAKPFQ